MPIHSHLFGYTTTQKCDICPGIDTEAVEKFCFNKTSVLYIANGKRKFQEMEWEIN